MCLLGGHFEHSSTTVLERNKFSRHYQLPGEGIVEYVAGLRTLSISCQFRDQHDENLTDQFHNGESSHRLEEQLFAEGVELHFIKAVDITLHFEQATHYAAECTTGLAAMVIKKDGGKRHTHHVGDRRDARTSQSEAYVDQPASQLELCWPHSPLKGDAHYSSESKA